MSRALIISGQVVGLAAALFLSLFALDAFAPDMPFWRNLVEFIIHLVPSILLAIFVLLARRWPVAGGVMFIVAALLPFVLLSNALWINASLAALPGFAGALLLAGGIVARVAGRRL